MRVFLSILTCALMMTLTILPTSSLGMAEESIQSNNNGKTNVTIISDGIEYYYSKGALIHSNHVINESTKLEIERNSYNEDVNSILKIIDNNDTLLNIYRKQLDSGIKIEEIREYILQEKEKLKQADKPPSNETVEKRRLEKKLSTAPLGYENTYGFAPATKGANWNSVLYDDFTDNDIRDGWEEYYTAGAQATAENTYLHIHSPNSGSTYAYVRSHDLDIYNSNTYSNMYYCISADFKLLGNTGGYNHWVFIFNNDQLEIVLDTGDNVGCYDSSFHELYDGLTTSDWYTVKAYYDIDATTYYAILYNRATGVQVGSPQTCNKLPISPVNNIKIGDDENGPNNFGYLYLDNIRVTGISKAKFYQNFDHGFWYNWRNQMSTTTQTMKVDMNGDLMIDSTDLALANSAIIDYDPTQDYQISTWFKIVDDGQDYMRIIDNNKVIIYVYGQSLYYYNTGGATLIWTLTIDKWYFLEAAVTATNCQYKIYLDDPRHVGNPAPVSCDSGDARYYLRVGNFANDYGNMRMRFLKLMGSISAGGSSDGLSNIFEDYPKTQIFGDDIENLWSNENSYEKYTSTEGGTIRWKRGDAKEGSNPHCSGGSSWCYYINPSGDQTAETQELWTPAIYVTYLPAKDIVLQFDQWYKIKNGDIASIVLSRSNSWSTLRTNIQTIQAPTGDRDSGGWLYIQSITIPASTWDGYNYIRIGFRLYTNGDSSYNLGWFIDDLRIYATLSDSSQGNDPSDTDGDNLNDGVEYYILGSSPIRADTDEDGLSDYNEWSLDHLNNPMLEEGQANASTPDLFIEIDKMNHGFAPEARARMSLVFRQHHITIHFNTISPYNANNAIPSQSESSKQDCASWKSSAPPNTVYFDSNFNNEYHYMCLARNDIYPYDLYGDSTNPGDYFIVWDTRCDSCNNADYIQQGQVTMHELGHNFGLSGTGTYSDGDYDAMKSGCWGNSNNYDYTPEEWENLGFGNALSTIEHQ